MKSLVDQDQVYLRQRFSESFLLSGPAMRPAPEDLASYWAFADEWIQSRGKPRVLLLGVTPELYRLPWPKGTGFLAVDSSQAMIDAAYQGLKDSVRCADWLSLDLTRGFPRHCTL